MLCASGLEFEEKLHLARLGTRTLNACSSQSLV